MTEITVDVESGEVCPIPIPLTSVDIPVISGAAHLCGWSLREASGDTAVNAEGNAAAPGAGAAVATTPAVVAGTYSVAWTVGVESSAAAADTNNFALFVGGVQVATSVNPGAIGEYAQPAIQVAMATGATVQVKAIGAASAGSTYSASISVIPAPQVDAVVEIRDGTNPIAEIAIPVSGESSRSFGTIGLKVRSNVLLHMVSGSVTGAVYVRYDAP